MSLGAYPNGLADVRKTVAWQDAAARLSLADEENGGEGFDVTAQPKEIEERLIADVLRRLHAEQAEKLAEQDWDAKGEQGYLIEEERERGGSVKRVSGSEDT